MEYYSATRRNETGSFVETWVDLESVTQSEVKSEGEKQILYINAYMWNQKNCIDEPISKAGIETQTLKMDLQTWGGGDKLGGDWD